MDGKGGSKGKYEYWISKDGLILLEAWARNGLTDEQIAHNMGINVATLYNYKNKYVELCNALKKGKEIVDIEVENALYKKAKGFKEIVKKAIKVKTIEYNANGKRLRESEEVIYADEEVYIPPETTAQIFWLKNRNPEAWRDRQDVNFNANINNKTLNAFVMLEKLPEPELVKLIETVQNNCINDE